MLEKKDVSLAISGVATGAVNGLFGGGGGMVVVPLLIKNGLEEKKAHATAIAVILPLCIFSAIIYFISGSVRTDVVVPVIIGETLGGFVGAVLLGKLPSKTVGYIFAILMFLAGVRTIF